VRDQYATIANFYKSVCLSYRQAKSTACIVADRASASQLADKFELF
jgi:hypothetical protein